MVKILFLLFMFVSYEIKAIVPVSIHSSDTRSQGFIIFAEDTTECYKFLTDSDLIGYLDLETNTVIKGEKTRPSPLYLVKEVCIKYITSNDATRPSPKVCRYKKIRSATQEEVNKYNSCSAFSVYNFATDKCEFDGDTKVLLGFISLVVIVWIFIITINGLGRLLDKFED